MHPARSHYSPKVAAPARQLSRAVSHSLSAGPIAADGDGKVRSC